MGRDGTGRDGTGQKKRRDLTRTVQCDGLMGRHDTRGDDVVRDGKMHNGRVWMETERDRTGQDRTEYNTAAKKKIAGQSSTGQDKIEHGKTAQHSTAHDSTGQDNKRAERDGKIQNRTG